MTLLIAFGFGWVASSLYSQYWAKLKPAVGRALAVVFGRQSAPTNSPKNPPKSQVDQQFSVENQPENVVDQPDKNPAKMSPTIGSALKNILAFFGGLLVWMARNPVMAIGIVLLLAFLLLGRGCSPFEFGKSKGELRLEGELARAELRVQELERERDAEIADISRDVAVIRTQIRAVSQRGHDEIAAATPAFETPIDASLAGAWRNSIERLRDACANQASANSCGSELAG